MELHCPNCHELLDRVATACPACRLDLTAPRGAAPAPVEADPEKERAELLAAVVALGETRPPHRPPAWQASVPLPAPLDLRPFAGFEADILPRRR
jgi:predicted amidophosphoribosyltransferase